MVLCKTIVIRVLRQYYYYYYLIIVQRRYIGYSLRRALLSVVRAMTIRRLNVYFAICILRIISIIQNVHVRALCIFMTLLYQQYAFSTQTNILLILL